MSLATTTQEIEDAVQSVYWHYEKQPHTFHQVCDAVRTSPMTVLVGVGKSLDVARLGASLLQSVGVPAIAVHATDMLHGSIGMLGSTTVVILLSHSGNTDEVVEVQHHLNRWHVVVTGGSGTCKLMNALMSRTVLRYEVKKDGSKHGTIPSASTAAQHTWISAIACQIADTQRPEQLGAAHPHGTLGNTYDRLSL